MHFRLFATVAALSCGLLRLHAADICEPFPAEKVALELTSKSGTLCFRFTVPANAALQFTASQPVDLALDVEGNGIRLRLDSFEIGTETATLLGGGEFRIQVVALDQTVPRNLIVSKKAISLQEATRFREAENLATETKQKGTEKGILDSLNLWKELKEQSSIARTQLKLGDFWHAQKEYEAARTAYDDAAEMCGSLDDLRCRTEALNNSGVESRRLADFDSARNSLQEAARGWGILGSPIFKGRTLSNLGELCRTVHEYRQALSFDQKAADILEPIDKAAFARVLNEFGLSYQALAEYARAREYFERALRALKSVKDAEGDLVRIQINLGRTFLSMGRPAAASALLTQAKITAQNRADRSALADASTNLGQAFLAQNLVAEANHELLGALPLHQALKDRRFAATDQHLLGIVALRENRLEEAKTRFVEAASIRSQSNLRVEASESYYELARLEFEDKNFEIAKDLADTSLDLTEKVRVEVSSPALRASFSSARRKIVDLLINIEVCRGDPDALKNSFLIAEHGQGRAILDLLAENSLLTPPPSDLLEKEVRLDRQIGMISNQMLFAPERQLGKLRGQGGMLIAQRENVEAEIRELQPERRLGRSLDSVERLQRDILPANTALLEFHVSEPESYLWFVTSDSLELFQLSSQKKIERHANEFISLFARINDRKRSPELEERFRYATRALSRDLLENLRGKNLPGTVILVCDGALNRIPFEALTIPGKGQAIGLTHNLVRIPSAGYLEVGREVRARSEFPKAFLGVVDPVFSVTDPRLGTAAAQNPRGAELPRLPFTFELERVNSLAGQSGTFVLRGFQANKRRLEQINLDSYAFVHLSTHAIIDDKEPELSRVALSLLDRSGRAIDGYLHPAQFSEWHLSGSTVVLSACETALGKQLLGEGLWGLTAALFKAGASQLVLTLSPVDAEGSSEFFSQVYGNLFGRKARSTEQALTAARRYMASSPRWSDPYYWASFITVGRPTVGNYQGPHE